MLAKQYNKLRFTSKRKNWLRSSMNSSPEEEEEEEAYVEAEGSVEVSFPKRSRYKQYFVLKLQILLVKFLLQISLAIIFSVQIFSVTSFLNHLSSLSRATWTQWMSFSKQKEGKLTSFFGKRSEDLSKRNFDSDHYLVKTRLPFGISRTPPTKNPQ